jgi:hypothetical protein
MKTLYNPQINTVYKDAENFRCKQQGVKTAITELSRFNCSAMNQELRDAKLQGQPN